MDISGEARNNSNLQIPYSTLTVDHTLPVPEMKPSLVKLCKDLFKKWSNLDESHFSAQRVAGGITNLLLKVSIEEQNGNMVHVTVRLYGPNTEYVIDRERELKAIHYLSAAGFGAKLLGVFGNGMVQSFIHARTLEPLDLRKPKLAAEIAKQLNRFHQVDIPGSKEPQLWNDISKFFERASSLTFDDHEKQKRYSTISFKEVHTEIIKLKELTGHLNAPVVFSHNDLLSGNLMLNEDKGLFSIMRMRRAFTSFAQTRYLERVFVHLVPPFWEKLYIIDFEYGSYSYRGFDIGNHFNEYAGYDCDYTLYPNKDEQYHFFRHYLQSERPDKVSEKDLEALYVETSCYMLASHLYWALWALIQAKMSPIDFNYLGYFFLRYNEYMKQKDTCLSLGRSYLSESKTR